MGTQPPKASMLTSLLSMCRCLFERRPDADALDALPHDLCHKYRVLLIATVKLDCPIENNASALAIEQID